MRLFSNLQASRNTQHKLRKRTGKFQIEYCSQMDNASNLQGSRITLGMQISEGTKVKI